MLETLLGWAVLGIFGAIAINVIPLIIMLIIGAAQNKKDKSDSGGG